MLIEKTLLGEINKEEQAIERIKYFQNKNYDNKNIVAFSGGKDSIVLKDLVRRAGIEVEYIYSPPSVDPPELINYIKKYHPDVKWQPYIKDNEGKEITMWTLIPKKLMPPSRIARYCCDVMKERTGDEGDTVYLGVRWYETPVVIYIVASYLLLQSMHFAHDSSFMSFHSYLFAIRY